MLLCVFWPLLSWFDFEFTRLDTDYYSLRYVCMVVYMAISNLPYSAVDNMQILLGDNFFLI